MNATRETTDGRCQPGQYEIRLKGSLDRRWADSFDGMRLSYEGEGDSVTVISGPVTDQAALHGLLRTVRDLGLPLISVTRMEAGQPDAPGGQS